MTGEVVETGSNYNWTARVGVGVLAAVAIGGLVARAGRLGEAALIVLIVAIVTACWVAPPSMVALIADGDELRIRGWRGWRTIKGAEVARVRHVFNGRSPDFALVTAQGRRTLVPTSSLVGGYRILFAWLDAHAPHAELDPLTAKARARLEPI